MEVSQFPGGHSNLTYLVRFGGAELVMRRPPLGPVPPKAHDMAREYRWLAALNPVFELAPRPYLLCDDPSIIGSVFYLMERRRGIVVRHDEPMPLEPFALTLKETKLFRYSPYGGVLQLLPSATNPAITAEFGGIHTGQESTPPFSSRSSSLSTRGL
jgi:hypothetical protein